VTPSINLFYAEMPLTQGQVAIVDAADYEWLRQWKWHAHWNTYAKKFYVDRTVRTENRNRTVLIHREILGLGAGDKRDVDHINGNPLDNRRINLRVATTSQNIMNSKRRSDNKSGYKCVSLHKASKTWQFCIRRGKSHFGSA
jgi:hypothetical protein